MSKFNYNKQRHLELLKLKYSQEKVLTSTEESELNEYSSLLDNTLDWETKEQYIDLLDLEKLIRLNFILNLKNAVLLLSPHEKSKEFSNFISEIMDFCYSYSEVFESYLPGEKIDSYDLEFRNSMEKIYLKIHVFYLSS